MTKTGNNESFQITKNWEKWEPLAEKLKENLIELNNKYLKAETNVNHKNEEAGQLMKTTG